uniref:E3 ubiquitin-protein ligase MARCH8 n=1 Tax=Bactrocera latifrons TaxID=174628 RepID=A0A0K8UMH8_BACLA
MDAENTKKVNDNRGTTHDAPADVKKQLNLQRLAVLAAEAAARFKAVPSMSKDTKPTLTTTTTTSPIELVAIVKQTNLNMLGRECSDKPLSQKSDDSDCTLQSDQSENNAMKTLALPATDEKTFVGNRTLDRILLAHSEQTITTAHVELDCNSSQRTAHELVLQAGSGCIKQMSLTALRDGAIMPGAEGNDSAAAGNVEGAPQTTPTGSVRSIGSLVCRICHNSEDPERLVSPCLCKGSLTYVHIHCLERWISTSRSTVCELCQFQYNTVQTLRYTCFQSLRMWYSRSMSRRALQEDCQMFSLLTLVAFGIIGTLLVGIQYYFLQGQSWLLSRMWTKGWLIFFLFTTLTIYLVNIYMILKSQLSPWYMWWQSARDIKLILENRKPFQFRPNRRLQNEQLAQELSDMADMTQQQQQQATTTGIAPQASETHTPQQPYHISPPIPPTFAAISIPPVHIGNTLERAELPVSLSGIELQRCGDNGNFGADDVDTLSCCGKGPRAMASCKGVAVAAAVAFHCNKLTASATIEIPLEGCLYEFETML